MGRYSSSNGEENLTIPNSQSGIIRGRNPALTDGGHLILQHFITPHQFRLKSPFCFIGMVNHCSKNGNSSPTKLVFLFRSSMIHLGKYIHLFKKFVLFPILILTP
ncbi:hypothetical protein CDAR_602091 [Caerostris darwini]|uniref:Uncharacterized protein n=1 Tax=Caerostris darwini TaxID=1538125 RepID=A0AAV4MBI1_9ARAC|nr:hypothetical protein CDAR_602091 [Caerostris darwini]